MALRIIRFENCQMNSNTYIIVDDISKACIIIDPGEERAVKEVKYLKENLLTLEYVFLTHTHPDHCLGANSLKDLYANVPLVYHDDKFKEREFKLFFRLLQDDRKRTFQLMSSDMDLHEDTIINWHGHNIKLLLTPGHSVGSICIDIDGTLYTGDTLIPFPPYFNGRGSDIEEWEKSVNTIVDRYKSETMVFPGHGEVLTLGDWKANKEYSEYKKRNV